MGDVVTKSGLTDTHEIIDYLDKFGSSKVQEILDKAYIALAEQMRCHKQALFMKRESICEKGLFLAKKRYALSVWDNEGVRYKEPELKMMGLEAIRSTTPTACREAIKETVALILNGSEEQVQKYISDFRNRFDILPYEDIARNSSLGELGNYEDINGGFKKATPSHVKGAIVYNDYLKKLNLQGKYTPIYRKDKIKYCYLKTPNPLMTNVIAVPGALPAEFNLEKYLDRQLQYEKTYLEPIKRILDIIGWETEKKTKVLSFFE